MKRREFITLVGGAAVAASRPARAQVPAKSHRIGILETVSPSSNTRNLEALRRGLRELGYVENQNYILEYRSADGEGRRFPALAAELVRLGVDLIVTRGTPAARAARDATETIPIVMAAIGEPLGTGRCCQSGAAGWQCDGPECVRHGTRRQARRIAQGAAARKIDRGLFGQHGKPCFAPAVGRDQKGGADARH